MVNPRLLIDSPTTFTPTPYGLVSVAATPTPPNGHWHSGVTYQTRCNNAGGTTYDECITVTGAAEGPVPPPTTKEPNVELIYRGALAFTVYTYFECSPVGMPEAQKIAEAAMAQTFPYQVERTFWTGQADDQPVIYPHLSGTTEIVDGNDVLLQTAAVTGNAGGDVVCALGFLEEQIAQCYNGVGVIHVPTRALPTLADANLIEARGAALYTRSGNKISVGAGYPGTGPGGAAVAQCESWLFATGPVFMFSGAVRMNTLAESFDRASNTQQMIAERTVLLAWDCCHAGVQIDLGTSP